MSSKIVGYALGRTVQASDLPLIDKMVAAGNETGFSTLIGEIVTSRQFRYRLGVESVTSNKKLASIQEPGKEIAR